MPLESSSSSRDPRRRRVATSSTAKKAPTTNPSSPSKISGASGGSGGGKKGGKGWLIILIILLLASNGAVIWFLTQEQKVVEDKNEEIKVQTARADSLQTEYENLDSTLQLRMQELAQLGEDTTELSKQLQSLRSKYNKMVGARNYWRNKAGEFNELEQMIATLKSTVAARDSTIEVLKSQRDSLYSENRGLKENLETREDSLNALAAQKEKLNKQVEIASVLNARTVKVSYIDKKGREEDEPDDRFKGRKVVKLKVDIELIDNKVAKVESKDVFLRIIQPSGSTLSDLSQGGGTFETEDSGEKVYTARQEFLFDNQSNPSSFVYEKGDDWEEGDYRIEVYIDGHLAGQKSFTIR